MSDVLQEAQSLYKEALEAMRDQRLQISEDLKFSDPSDPQQWDEDVKRLRETDPGGKRPCLVVDQTGQYVANVSGQVEQRPPSIHAIPVGGGADKKAAEQIDGRFRHIEHASRASQHYARALTSAARTGVGYLVVRPEYVDRSLGWQEPRISSEADPLAVVFDPWSVETDGSDADFGYILTPVSVREFERRWKGRDLCDFGDLERTHKDDDRKSVLVAEEWWKKAESRNMIVHLDASGEEVSSTEDEFWAKHAAGELPEQREPRTYVDKRMVVMWRRMSGADVLEESTYQADSIGIVPVYGYVGFTDGRMRYCGIPRRARVPQQAYNYHVSEQLAHIATAPKSPWLVSKRAAAGVEAIWDKAGSESRAWLPWNDKDGDGAPIAPPNRVNNASNLVNHEAGAAQALRDIQASIGMYQANLGAPSNEQSGVAIESRKQQGEASTAHFPSHMAASLGQVGKIVMQMDARLTDTRRKQPIIGADESAGAVTVDPEQKEAFTRTPDGVSINPNVGSYGVRVVVGASYSTQRSQNNAAFTEMMRGNPALVPAIAPFWAQTLDIAGSDKLAQALTAMAPDPVKAILQPEGGDKAADPAALAKQLADTKQALNEAIQHARDAQQDADQAHAEAAQARQSAESKVRELDIKAYQAETERLKVTGANEEQIQAIVASLIPQMLGNPDPLPDEPAAGPGPAAAPQLPAPTQDDGMTTDEPDAMQEQQPIGLPEPGPGAAPDQSANPGMEAP